MVFYRIPLTYIVHNQEKETLGERACVLHAFENCGVHLCDAKLTKCPAMASILLVDYKTTFS